MTWSRTRRPVFIFGLILATTTCSQFFIQCTPSLRTLDTPGTLTAITILSVLSLDVALLVRLTALGLRNAHLGNLLRHTLRELSGARRAERERIARELHDGVSQMLLCACHTLEQQASSADPQEREVLLARALQQLHEAIVEIRRVSHGYKSILLNARDLREARKLLGKFSGQTHIQLDLDNVEALVDSILNPEAKGALLRIAQKALANVQKHSGASRGGGLTSSRLGHLSAELSRHDYSIASRR